MKAGAFVLGVFISTVAFGQVTWPPLSSGASARWYVVPLDNNFQASGGLNFQVIIRNPSSTFSSALVDLSTSLDGSMKEYSTENGTENTFWSGPDQYLAASWGQFGAKAEAYGSDVPATADGTAEFTGILTPKFAFILDVDRLSTATFHYLTHSTFPGRLQDRDTNPDGLHIDDIKSMTLRAYFLESMALSINSLKGLNGVNGTMKYTASGYGYGLSGSLQKTVNADGSYLSGWLPDPTDYDTLPSWALGVRPFDVIMYRQPLGPGDTHYRFIGYLSLQTTVMTARSYSYKKSEAVTGTGGTGGVTGGTFSATLLTNLDRLADPTSSTSFAKERLRLFEMRVLRFNEAVIRLTPSLANNTDISAGVSFAIKDSAGTVIYQEDGVPETEISLPIDPGAGSYTLEVSSPGYTTAVYPFTIADAQVLDAGTITLQQI
ncbi:MAG TPA: hypothetical protein VNI20_06070 [Fimbriimonadaceae bacterium]|nr:hypothetical protein [Fimbriimonadaceae bacterium]